MRMKNPAGKGFTLIELMIAVAIVGIIAAVAYPNYIAHVQKTRRIDCAAVLMNVANAMERRFTTNGSYANFNLADFRCPSGGGTTTYDLGQTVAADGSTFSVTATISTSGPQAGDTACGNLTITNTGAKSVSGSKGVAGCWK